ncbi:invasion associated locus B family protein [Enterovirga aerilata]|uniref:Invasion associated locus B family protein n=1 Tax=Enterovirga aerilata TaxID=2730920 RepID=A0A849I7L3_9HYPH|nr:invasion associated locus B family protein [Enterovirga sp. DB1703]NNM72060.1 invasion associated locus B family protein [Enterovirga sp. DB1703]
MSLKTRLACCAKPLGLAVSITTVLGGAEALAQAQRQQRPAAPAQSAPAQPAQQNNQQGQQAQTGPLVVQVKPEPSQAEWTKVCGKDPGNQTEICYTTRDFVSDQGQPVLAAAIYDIKSNPPQKVVRFLMPLGLLLRPGIRFAVDQGSPMAGTYTMCFPNGCFAEATGLKDDVVNSMKKGTTINVSVQNQVGREVTFAVPLAGFAKAFDGAPIDPQVLAEQQKRLQEELEKRSEELRKRLEASAGQGGAPAAGGAAPASPAPKQ